MTVFAIVAIAAGVIGLAGALLFGQVRRREPAAAPPERHERPGTEDQFGTWPAIRVPDHYPERTDQP